MLDINRLNETPHLLDVLLEIEDVLDSMDLYVFKNWIRGEVIFGPHIKRYSISISLQFKKGFMPDPLGGMRMQKHGIFVEYKNTEDGSWVIDLGIPRRLINGMNDSDTDFYDDEVDLEDVESAVDMGIDGESGYTEAV